MRRLFIFAAACALSGSGVAISACIGADPVMTDGGPGFDTGTPIDTGTTQDSGGNTDTGTGGDAMMCMNGLTPCNGSCVDLKMNDTNCGMCGHSCQGGKCMHYVN